MKIEEIKDEPIEKEVKPKDDGIPYYWAVELMKNYVPDLIENSPKMEIFFCILRESLRLGDRMLVFSQSLLTLNLIEKFLQANTVNNTEIKWAKNLNYYRKYDRDIHWLIGPHVYKVRCFESILTLNLFYFQDWMVLLQRKNVRN